MFRPYSPSPGLFRAVLVGLCDQLSFGWWCSLPSFHGEWYSLISLWLVQPTTLFQNNSCASFSKHLRLTVLCGVGWVRGVVWWFVLVGCRVGYRVGGCFWSGVVVVSPSASVGLAAFAVQPHEDSDELWRRGCDEVATHRDTHSDIHRDANTDKDTDTDIKGELSGQVSIFNFSAR